MQEIHETTKFMGSAIVSEIQSCDMYLTLKARLFDLKANLNGVRVTEAFLNEIVMNESKYIGIPLYADIRGLIAKQPIGHMYNPRTGEFLSTQIGSFYHYEKEVDGDDVFLIGYARVMKRNKAVCAAIADLFANQQLKFSFELSCGQYSKENDGTIVIDEHPSNYFEGEAIVSFPACREAIALQLVAECLQEGGDKAMNETIETIETTEQIVENQEQINAVAERDVNEPICAAETVEEVEETESVQVQAETISEVHEETSKEVVEATCKKDEAAAEATAETTTPEDVPNDSNEQNQDQNPEDEKRAISALIAQIEEIRKTIAELSETVSTLPKKSEPQEVIFASMKEADAQTVNPFMGSITAPSGYSLLETAESGLKSYSLLERA